MKHVPIMFKPEMLEQILAGRKTQTRRPVTGRAIINESRWRECQYLYVKEPTPEYPNKMFMPKKLAKVWLRLSVALIAEPVQDITEEGAKKRRVPQ